MYFLKHGFHVPTDSRPGSSVTNEGEYIPLCRTLHKQPLRLPAGRNGLFFFFAAGGGYDDYHGIKIFPICIVTAVE